MQRIIIRILVPALIPIVLGFILFSALKENEKELMTNHEKEIIIVRSPRVYLWILLILILFAGTCIFFMIFFPNGVEYHIWVYIIYFIFILMGIFLVVKVLVWRIYVFKNEIYFIYRTIFFKNIKVKYKECLSYASTTNTIILKINKRKFYIDKYSINFEVFFSMLKKYNIKREIKKRK